MAHCSLECLGPVTPSASASGGVQLRLQACTTSPSSLYQFSIAATINYHFIISQFKLEVLVQQGPAGSTSQSHKAEIKVSAGLHSFLEALGWLCFQTHLDFRPRLVSCSFRPEVPCPCQLWFSAGRQSFSAPEAITFLSSEDPVLHFQSQK